jgi:methionyl-tRNA formyltransferase
MRAVLVGAVEGSRVMLERIARAPEWTLALVVTLPLEKSARHSDFVDLGDAARAAGCEVRRIADINSDEAVEAIAQADADYLFVAGWSQICGPKLLSAWKDRVIGYHPAPLPRLRGRAVIPWTILNREPITAGTLFWIDEGVDSGPILAQEFFHVAPDETAASLYKKHMDALERVTDRALAALASPAPPRAAQDERLATWAARRTPRDGLIDWTRPAAEIERLVRAVGGPYPPASTFDGAHELGIGAARIEGNGERFVGTPGQVVSRTNDEFLVKCGHGTMLAVTRWSHPLGAPPKLHSILSSSPKEPSMALSVPAAAASARQGDREAAPLPRARAPGHDEPAGAPAPAASAVAT